MAKGEVRPRPRRAGLIAAMLVVLLGAACGASPQVVREVKARDGAQVNGSSSPVAAGPGAHQSQAARPSASVAAPTGPARRGAARPGRPRGGTGRPAGPPA